MLLSLLNLVPTQELKVQATGSFYLTFCLFDHVTVAGTVNYCE